MIKQTFVAILTTALASSGVFTLIQFLIKRHDEKQGKKDEVFAAITALNSELEAIERENKRDKATAARRRILRFSDEMLRDIRHSEEMFHQVLDDITAYEDYCRDNPDYVNNMATAAIRHIKDKYDECLNEHTFLQ